MKFPKKKIPPVAPKWPSLFLWNKQKKNPQKHFRAVPVNTISTLKDEEAEKKHKLTKDWPVICYPIFFHAFFLLHGLFLFSGQIQSLLEFLPGGNWIFWGEFEMFLNFSQRRLNFSFEEIVFPPEGNCISPQPIRGNSIFSRGESRKKSPFLFVFLQIRIIPGGNLRFREFPQEKFPFSPREIPISPIPVWRNFHCRFPLFWSTKMETDRKNQLGKKNFNFDPLGASSILGLDREILSKTCFKQLSLKPSQEMLILLFGIKQFNLKIMPAKFHPIL